MKQSYKVVFCLCASIVWFLPCAATTKREAKPKKVAEWTVMVYAQADIVLNSFALQNFNAMATVGSNDKLNIIVQWNQPRKTGGWRYKIDKNKMTLINSGKNKSVPVNFEQDLIDFSQFTVTRYPAKHYAFIFWGHGVGIIDPEWSQLQNFYINPSTLGACPSTMSGNKLTKNVKSRRGILFDITHQTYLDNQGLANTLSHITQNVLHKKFDLIGMDACLMSTLEVFYQIKDFADYLVSSEEVELALGWNYPPFLDTLARSSVTPEQLAKSIVTSFESFYKNQTKFYTQSAVDLEGVDFLKQNIDHIVGNLALCKRVAPKIMKTVIDNARKLCFQLSISCYVDLHSLYHELSKQLTTLELEKKKTTQTTKTLLQSQQFKDLKTSLSEGITLLNNMILCSVSSSYLSRAKGISIYYPFNRNIARTHRGRTAAPAIDPSYFKTQFAQESLWLSFLQENLS